MVGGTLYTTEACERNTISLPWPHTRDTNLQINCMNPPFYLTCHVAREVTNSLRSHLLSIYYFSRKAIPHLPTVGSLHTSRYFDFIILTWSNTVGFPGLSLSPGRVEISEGIFLFSYARLLHSGTTYVLALKKWTKTIPLAMFILYPKMFRCLPPWVVVRVYHKKL